MKETLDVDAAGDSSEQESEALQFNRDGGHDSKLHGEANAIGQEVVVAAGVTDDDL